MAPPAVSTNELRKEYMSHLWKATVTGTIKNLEEIIFKIANLFAVFKWDIILKA